MYIILTETKNPLIDSQKSIKVFSTRTEAENSISSYLGFSVIRGEKYVKSREKYYE